jgi:succinate dehydrogenase / fumarate reductase flavoprotein subunit
LAHVGDRTGLELIRTLQQKIVGLQQEDKKISDDYESRLRVFAECTITDILLAGEGENRRVAGAFGYRRDSGKFVLFEAPTVIIATGGIGRSFKVSSNSWEYTGDGHALALRSGGTLVNMEFIQFHPTGMVWPPSVKGLLVTESVRGDGGVLTNSEDRRFMFDYIPDVFKDQYAKTEEEADGWYTDPENNKRPPELLPRDEVSRSIMAEVKAGRGSPHGGVFLDVSKRLSAETIKEKLPSMWHQFKELADVDITEESMEVGPTCHYVMGGVEVDSDSAAAVGVSGLFCAGEAAGGLHGSNRLGGNSLSDLLVFGRRAGMGAVEYLNEMDEAGATRPSVRQQDVDAAVEAALAPFNQVEGENPYTVQQDLQDVMADLVGIIRTGDEMRSALDRLAEMRVRVANVAVMGGREYNPGWHLALDLHHQMLVSECVAKSALAREESRGGHTRNDFQGMDPNWRMVNLICRLSKEQVDIAKQDLPWMPEELVSLFAVSELSKYMTEVELSQLRVPEGAV